MMIRPQSSALCSLLSLSLFLVSACDEKKPSQGEGASGAAGAAALAPAAASAAASARTAGSASAAAQAPAPATSQRALTGNKALRERLLGKWTMLIPPARRASIKVLEARAEAQMKAAKTPQEKRAAKDAKTTVEELALSWTEFSKDKRTTKAPPDRLIVQRPYEVTREDGRTLIIRVWDATNPRGAFEEYNFQDDNTMTSPRGDHGEVDTYIRK
jgi:hypothetical protein